MKESPETKISWEAESGDDSSTEELEAESPRSVMAKKKIHRWVHSQVLKIREEDSHLGEDIVNGGGLISPSINKGNNIARPPNDNHRRRRRPHDVLLLTRQILPCSPLSGKTRVAAV